MKRTFAYTAAILLLAVCFSCRKGLKKPRWEADLLIPIAKTSLDVSDLLADSLLITNPDNSLTLSYQSSFFSLQLDSLTTLLDTIVQDSFQWTLGTVTLPPGFPIFQDTQNTKYDLDPAELVLAILRSGTVTVNLESTIDEDIEVSYELPLATKGGIPFIAQLDVPANGQASKTYDLSGYELNLRGSDQNDFNTFTVIYRMSVGSNPVVITNSDKVFFDNTFNNLVTEYAKGYFGQLTYTGSPASEYTDLFNNFTAGNMALEYVDLVFRISNGIGVDLQATVNNIKSLNTVTGNNVNLQHTLVGNPINITRATEDNSGNYPPIDPGMLEFTMNTDNSNAEAFIANLPDQIEYAMDLAVNPFGNNSGSNDFFYYGTDIDFSLDLEMPLSFIANSLTLIDTTDYVFANRPQPEENGDADASYPLDGYLCLYADNGFPFAATVQLYSLDSNYAVIDSLISSGHTIAAASLDANNKVTSKKQSKVLIPLNEVLIDMLYDTRFMIMKAAFTTAGQPDYVKIYSDYGIDLKLVGDFVYTIDPN